MTIDLRSDTVTRPTPGMRAAMAAAEVGDDVFGDDPTVNRLQERVATLLGKEACVFMPSGTMAQPIALRVWCEKSGVRTVGLHPSSHLERNECAVAMATECVRSARPDAANRAQPVGGHRFDRVRHIGVDEAMRMNGIERLVQAERARELPTVEPATAVVAVQEKERRTRASGVDRHDGLA